MSTKIVIATVLLLALAGVVAARGDTDSIPAEGGDIRITPIIHGSVRIEHAGIVIHVDPWSRGDYPDAAEADLIVVTDIHGDHLDPEMIDRLRTEDTVVVVPAAAAAQIEGATVLANGERRELVGVGIEAVPMYNLKRGPQEGARFHEEGRGNGYLLTLGGRRVYVAGDTECIPEMKALTEIDVAFVPMNLPYTMTAGEAAECVRAFQPGIVYPYHYRGSNPEELTSALQSEPAIEVRIREWYPVSQ